MSVYTWEAKVVADKVCAVNGHKIEVVRYTGTSTIMCITCGLSLEEIRNKDKKEN